MNFALGVAHLTLKQTQLRLPPTLGASQKEQLLLPSRQAESSHTLRLIDWNGLMLFPTTSTRSKIKPILIHLIIEVFLVG